jgi:hypothetical protein
MTKYNVGDKITVILEGTVRELDTHDSCMQVRDGNGYDHYVYQSTYGGADITVTTPAGPKYLPIEVGDLLKDKDGNLWFARAVLNGVYLYAESKLGSLSTDEFTRDHPEAERVFRNYK